MLGIAVATSVALFAWLWLAVARGSFWRSQPRLPAAGTARAWPSVTVVVPARDEAAQLPATLPALLAQDYAGQLRVIVVDDRSTDGTAAVASQLGADDPRLTVLAGRPAPPGWVGKVWALEQGVAAAGATEWLLFTDADIAHGSRVVSRLVSFAQSADKDMVSVMALLRCRDPWERLIVPAFVYFFAMLYPFRWVGRGRTAAAAGGCILIRRTVLAKAGGLAEIRGALIDDVSLAALVHRRRARLWLGYDPDVRSIRPYPRLADLWQMVARSAYTQLRYSPALLAGTVLGLLVLFAAPFAGIVAGAATLDRAGMWALATGLVSWLVQAVTYRPLLRYYGLPAGSALTLPAVGLLYLGMTVDSAIQHRRGRTGIWRGRATAS